LRSALFFELHPEKDIAKKVNNGKKKNLFIISESKGRVVVNKF
jgi:hypothetical protein